MAISLAPQTRPNVKFPSPGSGVEISLIGTRRRPWTEFGSNGVQKIGKDGRPRQQLVATGIVVSSVGVVAGPQGQERLLQVGEVVDVYRHAHHWAAWIEAERQHPGLQVGDVVLMHYTHDEPSSQSGANPKKVHATQFRRANPGEQHFVQQAEAAYYSLGFDQPDEAASTPPDTDDGGPFGAQGVQQSAPGYGQQAQVYPQQGYGQQPQAPAPAPAPQYAQPGQYGGVQPAATPPVQQPQPGYAPTPAPGYAPQQPHPGPGF